MCFSTNSGTPASGRATAAVMCTAYSLRPQTIGMITRRTLPSSRAADAIVRHTFTVLPQSSYLSDAGHALSWAAILLLPPEVPRDAAFSREV